MKKNPIALIILGILTLLLGIPRAGYAQPVPPTLASPGTSSVPGSTISTLTPTMQWQASAGATGYGLYISLGPAFTTLVYENEAIGAQTSLVLPAGTLQSGQQYRWNMRPRNALGWGAFSSRLYFQTCQAPAAPAPLVPGAASAPGPAISTLSPTMQWQASAGATGYGLYVSIGPSFTTLVYDNDNVQNVTTLLLPPGTLQTGQQYRWNMRARNACGWSGFTSPFYFQTTCQTPAAPSLLAPGTASAPGPTVGSLTPTLQWQASSGATNYGLYVSVGPAFTNLVYENENIGTQTSIALPAGILQAGQQYRWNMRARNACGWGAFTSPIYFQSASACSYLNSYPYPAANWTLPDPYLFFYRECTSYVAWKMNQAAGTTSPPYFFSNYMRGGHFGNAENWAANAAQIGFAVDAVPAVGAIAHWGTNEGMGSLGHVAYVEAVNTDGSVAISQYNVSPPHEFSWNCTAHPPRFIHITSPPQLLPPPTLIAPSNAATNVAMTPTFSWTGVTGADRYWLMVATSASALPTDPYATSCPACVTSGLSGNTGSTTYTAPDPFPFNGTTRLLSPNTTYYWQVQGWNTSGAQGNYSNVRSFTVGSSSPCYANCDGSTATPVLTANDFQCFINAFATATAYANCDGSTAAPILTANDFQCFINAYAGGCP